MIMLYNVDGRSTGLSLHRGYLRLPILDKACQLPRECVHWETHDVEVAPGSVQRVEAGGINGKAAQVGRCVCAVASIMPTRYMLAASPLLCREASST